MEQKFKIAVRYLLLLSLVLLCVLAFIKMVSGFLIALLLAGITAALTYDIRVWLTRIFKGKKSLASIVLVILILLLFIIPLLFFSIMVVDEGVQAGKFLVSYFTDLDDKLKNNEANLPSWMEFIRGYIPNLEEIIEKLNDAAGQIGNSLMQSIGNITQSTVGFFLQLFIYVYALFFFQIYSSNMIQSLKSYLPLLEENFDIIVEKVVSVSRATLKGAILISTLQGFLIGVALWLLGVPSPIFLGALAVIFSVIPSVGSGLIWVPVVIVFIVQQRYGAAIGLGIWGALIVGSIDNVLRPRLVGKDAQMSDLMILLSTLGGIGMFGISGFILGPILAGVTIAMLQAYKGIFVSGGSSLEV